MNEAPWGYDKYVHTEVIPKPPPIKLQWHIGPVTDKTYRPVPIVRRDKERTPATGREDIIMQLTADQQVDLSISGQDAYGNPVEITGDTTWTSSDETIVSLTVHDSAHATAVAVGPVGSAAVSVTNDVNNDGSGDYFGSLAVSVVAGQMTEIVIEAGTPTDKPA